MSAHVETTGLSVAEAMRDGFLRQHTGRLVCSSVDGTETFFLLGGQLYLGGDSPWGARLDRVLTEPVVGGDDPFFDPHTYLATSLGAIVEGLSRDLVTLGRLGVRFEDDLGEVPDDLVGPVPTAELVMELAVRGRGEQELLLCLGGLETTLRAADEPRLRLRVPYLALDEVALLERLREPTTVRTLVGESNATGVTRRLVRLLAVGLLEPASEVGTAGASREVVERLLERVRHDLAVHPLRLPGKRHRADVGQLLGAYGGLSHHELLGVDTGATAEEVHAAFMEVARVAHPDHADPLGLGRSVREMEWLWARLVEAYLVLSDPVRAAEYQRDVGPGSRPSEHRKDAPRRRGEREALAREAYVAALDFVEAEEFHYATELLLQATRHDERPEYYSLLGHCQMQNPKWLRMAIDSFRRAVRLSPRDEELRGQLAEATEVYHLQQEREKATTGTARLRRTESPADRRARLVSDKLRSGWR